MLEQVYASTLRTLTHIHTTTEMNNDTYPRQGGLNVLWVA